MQFFVKDEAQGADNPDGYPTPATQYFANKCAAAAYKSLSEGAQSRPFIFFDKNTAANCRPPGVFINDWRG